jgi:RNA polymerase sigma-70 factor, ECF subfamily
VDDNHIIERVRGGDTEAFALLVERYHRPLLSFIRGLVQDAGAVEDLGQDVFLNVFRNLGEFQVERGVPFAAWLFIAARNRCVSHLRACRGRCFTELDGIGELPSRTQSAEELLLAGERRELVHKALHLLPEPFRATLLRSLAGQSLEEIALAQGLSSGTVKSRLFRAKKLIKAILEKFLKGDSRERI